MKRIIYDLSKELFSSEVFPGDAAPIRTASREIGEDSVCNLSVISMGSHNGTHIDAPKHFVKDGKDIEHVELKKCMGDCKVVSMNGKVKAVDVEHALSDGSKRLLIKGDIDITPEAAKRMTEMELWFLGVEGMTVGNKETGVEVHRILLGSEIVILESAVLKGVPVGDYTLICQPLKLSGSDGSPVRPLLIYTGDEKEGNYGD